MTEHSEGGAAVWVAGLVVVLAAGAATAHGLYEVALTSRTPAGIAWLYPVITDGLALVAYAATSRLRGAGRRYAWAVVVLAAGLSGLAQAVYLAGTVGSSPTALRFGVGAWPAMAAAIAAHLLFLIGTSRTAEPSNPVQSDTPPEIESVVQPTRPTSAPPVQTDRPTDVPAVQTRPTPRPHAALVLDTPETDFGQASTPRDKALDAARRYRHEHGCLPSVRDLETRARVSRGTAATALQELRNSTNGHGTTNNPSIDGPSA